MQRDDNAKNGTSQYELEIKRASNDDVGACNMY